MLAKETIYCFFFLVLNLFNIPNSGLVGVLFEFHMMEPNLLLLRRTSFSSIPFHEAYENMPINNHILAIRESFCLYHSCCIIIKYCFKQKDSKMAES